MKILIVLFLAICLSLSPSVAFCRDATKYSIDHNAYILESLSKEIYIFVAGLEKLEDNWPNRRHITTSIFNIIDKYNCDGKLYIVNRGLNAEVIDQKISNLLITIFIMNSLEYLDAVVIKFDIDAVKKGDPVKVESDSVKI